MATMNQRFSKTIALVAEILSILSLLCDPNKKNQPKVQLLIINRAPVVICRQSLMILVNDRRYVPALISLVLLLRNYIFNEEFFIFNKIFHRKISVFVERFKQRSPVCLQTYVSCVSILFPSTFHIRYHLSSD